MRVRFERLVCALFEHDVYFQSIGRSLAFIRSPIDRTKALFEYLRAIRFELKMLPGCDHIQVCTEENKRYLESFLPWLRPRIDAGMRAGIDTGSYLFPGGPREPYTMLFLGSFRHTPNQVALDWFARFVLPLIVAKIPRARLAGGGVRPAATPHFCRSGRTPSICSASWKTSSRCFLRPRCFVCPIRSGSGVRVKLLEAFASGIPVVSTTLGRRGTGAGGWRILRSGRRRGRLCGENDSIAGRYRIGFADGGTAARAEVVENWDMAVITQRLVDKYREIARKKREHNT